MSALPPKADINRSHSDVRFVPEANMQAPASCKEEISVLLVEQNVRAAVEIADRAHVLDDGQVVFSGIASEFAKDEQRVRALAGASAEEWTTV